jgi:hypothetical protein
VIASQQGRGLAEVAAEAGAGLLTSATSLKAALDLDWDDPQERKLALVGVLDALEAVEAYLSDDELGPGPEASAGIRIARRVREQDVLPAEEADDGLPALRRGPREGGLRGGPPDAPR